MNQFFFIVSRYNGFVLDISTGYRGGNLVLSEADGRFSQLWRWDEDCRLISKLGLVADIEGKRKKVGAACHAWNPHDGLNQKWRVEEGAIKSNLNNLVIDAATQPVSMYEVDGTSFQKWYFIPENAWGDFQLVQADPNPLNKAQFWKNLADNYLDVIIGYNIDEYEYKVHKPCNIMEECSSKLNQVATAPITSGVSLGLTIAGAATGATGGVTSSASSFVNHVLDKNKRQQVYKVTAPLFRATFSLQGFLNEYINNLREAAEFLRTPRGVAVAKDAYARERMARQAALGVWHTLRGGDTVYAGVKHLKEAKRIAALVDFIQADYHVVNEARIGLATNAAAPGVRLFGKTIVAAGTTGAKALSGSLAGFGIVFGIWDVVGGAKKITNGSELAKDFCKSSEDLRAESCRLIKLYKDLQ
ncbi:hypothetical protein ACROYT_G026532 [Oculina patagonica]